MVAFNENPREKFCRENGQDYNEVLRAWKEAIEHLRNAKDEHGQPLFELLVPDPPDDQFNSGDARTEDN